jgi:hypothetical protein
MFDGTSLPAAWFCSASNAAHAAFTGLFSLRRSYLGGVAYVYALQGQTARVEKMLPELEAKAVKAGHLWAVCLIYIGLNRKAEALRWLEKAYDAGDFAFDLDNPLLDPLRSDPAFEKLKVRAKAALPSTLR